MKVKGPLFLAFVIFFLWPSNIAFGHDVAEHLDPELLTGWRTWLHLSIQWAHLVAFALWLGLTMGTLLLGIKPSLDQLLYSSWILFLVFLATGTYNMEWSAGISETPSVLLFPVLEKIPYGVTYTSVLAAKLGLYVLTLLIALAVTLLHLQRQMGEAELRRVFLISESAIAVLLALATAVLLFYHEAADLWPTAIHSLGGVAAPEGPRGQTIMSEALLPPNDFGLLKTGAAWTDIGMRWLHLLGFGLWLGGSGVALVLGRVSPRRFLWIAWITLIVQIVSGVGNMARWTPFYLSPYIWNVSELTPIRFGRSYTIFMAAKHLLVITALSSLMVWTIRYLWDRETRHLSVQPLAAVSLLLGVAIAYIMMIVLLLHEGVDHAL